MEANRQPKKRCNTYPNGINLTDSYSIGGSSSSVILAVKSRKPSVVKFVISDESSARECAWLQNEWSILKKISHPNIISLASSELIQGMEIDDSTCNMTSSTNSCTSINCTSSSNGSNSNSSTNSSLVGSAIVLERAEQDLRQLLESIYPNVVELKYLRYCFRRITEAVRYLHESVKIAHNDIKLENVLLFGTEPKLADFGCASCHQADAKKQAKSWKNRSLKLAAPEILINLSQLKNSSSAQMQKVAAFDERKSDVFSLGVSFFNALFHQNPFEELATQTDSTYANFYQGSAGVSRFWDRPEIAVMVEFVGTFEGASIPHLKNLLEGMLHPNPSLRFSAKQVLQHPWFADVIAQE